MRRTGRATGVWQRDGADRGGRRHVRGGAIGATVSVTSQPLWRIRLGRDLPRFALYAMAVWGVVASARYAIAPPRPPTPRAAVPERPDRAAEGFAVLFARHYLTWSAARPAAYAESLAPFLGEGLAEAAGTELPAVGTQEALWAEVVQERRGPAQERVYTVACQTSGAGLLYLSVGVVRDTSGALALAGYPAFVGAPRAAPAQDVAEGFEEVDDPPLEAVVARALRNYLAGATSELAADLTDGAAVAPPGLSLTLDSLRRLRWLAGGGSVLALVEADDGRGARYALEYELDVEQIEGRWEISAIQTNPES